MNIRTAGEGKSTHVECKFIEFTSGNKNITLRGYSEQDWKKVGIFQKLACFFSGSVAHVNIRKDDGKMEKFVIVKDKYFKNSFPDVKSNTSLYETLKTASNGSIMKSGIKVPQEVVDFLKNKDKKLSQTVMTAVEHGNQVPENTQNQLGVKPKDSIPVLMDIEQTDVVVTRPAERQLSNTQPSRQPSAQPLSRQPSTVQAETPPAQKSAKEQAMDRLAEVRGKAIEWGTPGKVKYGLIEAAKNAATKGAGAIKQFNEDLKAVGYSLKMDKAGHITDVVKMKVNK